MPLSRIIEFFIFYKFNDFVGTIWGLFGGLRGDQQKKDQKISLKI